MNKIVFRLFVLILILLFLCIFTFAQETELDYSSAESYLDPEFYTISDPSQWDLSNPSFNWDLAFARDDIYSYEGVWYTEQGDSLYLNFYSHDGFYQYPDFYANSDPSKWDPDKVDYTSAGFWENVDLEQRPDFYTKEDFYSNLPAEMYSEIDYNEVWYTYIPDHSMIDESKYFADMGCKGCTLDWGEQDLRFSRDWIQLWPAGQCYVRPSEFPSGTFFKAVDYDNLMAIIPKNVEVFEVNSNQVGSVVINTQGREIKFDDSSGYRENWKINGIFEYGYDGTFALRPGDSVSFNGVKITNNDFGTGNWLWVSDENMLADYQITCSYGDDCVYLSSNEIRLMGQNYDVDFQHGNPYMHIPDEEDSLVITPLSSSESVFTRSNTDPTKYYVNVPHSTYHKGTTQSAVPLVGQYFRMQNGKFDIAYGSTGVMGINVASLFTEKSSTVPLNLEFVYGTQATGARIDSMEISESGSGRALSAVFGTITYTDRAGNVVTYR